MTEPQKEAESKPAEIKQDAGSRKMTGAEKWMLAILVAAVCLTVAIVYWPATTAQALCFDDNRYFVENPLVRTPSWNSAWRFVKEVLEPSTIGGYYQPLTMISLMLDYASVGPTNDISQFHRTALTLHVANVALIIVLLYLLFERVLVAAAAGLFFGLHPLTVEAVAWLGERKTLLAVFFTLWSLVFFVRYVREHRRSHLLWSLGMYALALLSKPTSTPLPVVMLLMDFWPLKRLKMSAVWEKIPFFVVGGVSAIITIISQSRTASVITPEVYGATRVPLVICHNIIHYPLKMVWPFNLTPHYPFPVPMNLSQPMLLIGVIGTAILIGALLLSLRWTRVAITGWLIFFIMALPTMQALQFSDVIASDKFVYLPSIGILLIVAALLCLLSGQKRQTGGVTARGVIISIAVLGLAAGEAIATRKYLACWQDSVSLWRHMVEVTPKATSPRNNLGTTLAEQERYDEAMEEFKIVLQIDPNDNTAYYNIGNIMDHRGKPEEAKQYYEKALQIHPKDSDAYSALGVLLIKEGKLDEAVELYRKGIQMRLEPPFMMYKGLGFVLLQAGRVDESIEALKTAARLKSDSPTFGNLGLALASKGEMEEAIECYKKAISMDPNNAEAYFNLGNMYLAKQWLREAAAKYESAIKAKPKYIKAYANLAVTLAQMGQLDSAIVNFRHVAELDPNYPDSYYNLASALADKGLTDEAIDNLRKTIELAPMDTAAHLYLAKLFMEKEQIEQARAEYEQVLKIDPNNADAQTGLQDIERRQKGGIVPPPTLESINPRFRGHLWSKAIRICSRRQ